MQEPGELDALVDSTRGLQPWRRIAHAAYGVLIVSAVVLLGPTRSEAVAALGAVLLAQVVLDLVRVRAPRANAIFFRAFRLLASPREAAGFASSTWYTLGAMLTLGLFPRPAALSGMLVLALADPAASVVGQLWGRHKVMGGSWEGLVTFVVVATALATLRHPLPVALAAAVVASLAERLSDPLDDNLTVPVVTAGIITLAAYLPLARPGG